MHWYTGCVCVSSVCAEAIGTRPVRLVSPAIPQPASHLSCPSMISMASRAILSSSARICLRCQLRSSGLLPSSGRVLSPRTVALRGIPPQSSRRWNSNVGASNLSQPPTPEPAPLGVSSSGEKNTQEKAPEESASVETLHSQGSSESSPKGTASFDNPPSEESALPVEEPPVNAVPVSPPITDSIPITAAGTASSSPAAEALLPTGLTAEPVTSASAFPTLDGIKEPPKPKKRGLPQLENRKLLILELPTRKRRKSNAVPVTEVQDEEVDVLSSNLLVFEQKADTFQLAISMMDPGGTAVSRKRFQQIHDQLTVQFNKDQIRSYVNYVHELHSKPAVRAAFSKGVLITLIMKDLWGVRISEEISERVDVIVEKKLPMGKEDIYFLIGQSKDCSHVCARKRVLTRTIRWAEPSKVGSRKSRSYYGQSTRIHVGT